jgi:predicted acetyltransferase
VPRSELQIVHPVAAEEIGGWLQTMSSTFREEPPEGERREHWVTSIGRGWVPDRGWGVRDRGRWVATLRTLDRSITVPGVDGMTEVLAADALTGVTVAATHRRRGLLSGMLSASLRAARERGDALAILISAEWPIYGRFGYAPATLSARYKLELIRRGSTVSGDVARVRQVDRDGFAALAPAVFAAVRRRRAGQVDRNGPWWDRTLGRDGWPQLDRLAHNYVVHDGPDGPDGLLAWSATRDAPLLPPRSAVATSTPFGANDAADQDLWAYLTGLDLVDEIDLWGPVDPPVRWLLDDARTLLTTGVVDYLWLRLLDVPAALAARRYSAGGELVLELVDDSAVSVAGRYRLSADAGGAACEPTRSEPDLTLTQRALASVYLGGFTLRGQQIAGTIEEHTPGALARADAMFATALAPWNATGF